MYNAKERSRANFDRQAAIYDTASFGAHARKLYPILLAQLAQIPHRWVLDVGCGTGELLFPPLAGRDISWGGSVP